MNALRRLLPAALLVTFGATALACSANSEMAPSAQYGGGYSKSAELASQPGSQGPRTGGDFEESPAAPPSEPSSTARDEGGRVSREVERQPENRPGLGTEWGETRFSRITTVPFVRAEPSSPFATASLFYNDAEGASAAANHAGFRNSRGGFTAGGGAVAIGLRDEHGGMLSGFSSGEKNFVVGEAGRRYTIVVKNRSGNRLEVVLSVDGLDVLDGREASFNKRGYLVDAGGELEVDGFRQSNDTVAAFRFGSVRGSYAGQKHGDTRNVGVIGLAVFHERGSTAFPWTQDEIDRRGNADPFPGRFATPPR